jgi:hypothetical protein
MSSTDTDVVWTVEWIERKTYRMSLAWLKEQFPDEYADAVNRGLTDEEFMEESLDIATPEEMGLPVLNTEWEMDVDRPRDRSGH